MFRRSSLLAGLVAGCLVPAAAALAADDLCAAAGVVMLEDEEGDWSGTVGSIAPQGIGTPEQDLLGLSLRQSDAAGGGTLLHFRLKVAGGSSALPPAAAWFTSFQSGEGPIYGVRLQTGPSGAKTYFSYVAGANNAGGIDGRFVTAGSEVPAVEGTGPDADGNIDIAVRAGDIGLIEGAGGQFLLGFNAATTQSTPVGVVAFTVDEAPSGLGRDGFAEIKASCSGGKSGFEKIMAGTLGYALLLPFGLIALLRRKRG